MGGTCSTLGGNEEVIKYWSGNLEGKGQVGDIGVHARMLLKWIVGKQDVKVGYRFSCCVIPWWSFVNTSRKHFSLGGGGHLDRLNGYQVSSEVGSLLDWLVNSNFLLDPSC